MSRRKKDLVRLDLTAAIGHRDANESSGWKWIGFVLLLAAALGLIIWGVLQG